MKETSVTRDKMTEEAQRRGWSVSYFGPDDFFYEISTPEGKRCAFHGSMPQGGSWIGDYISKHKVLTSEYLQHLGFTVIPFLAFTDETSAEAFLKAHHPIVVKPEDAEKSHGVTVGVETMAQLQDAIKEAKKYSNQVILQQQLTGKLYRVLVIGGTFCAATHRRAAFVTGDGIHTIRELIAEKNTNPLRTDDGNAPLVKISVEAVGQYIGLERLEAIPEPDVDVVLSAIDSISFGGEPADVTDSVHKDYVTFVEKIARELELPSCGLDMMIPDISAPMDMTAVLPVLEINSMPGFKMHYYPTAGGVPRNVAAALLDVTLGKVQE